MDGKDLSYGEVQRLSYKVARGLANSRNRHRREVAILSGNDALAFSCIFGISRPAVWCPINPRNEATEIASYSTPLTVASCSFIAPFRPWLNASCPICRSSGWRFALIRSSHLHNHLEIGSPTPRTILFECLTTDDIVMIVGLAERPACPKGVTLSGRSIEAMTALALMGFPFRGRPIYIALAPLTHAAGVFCFPIMTLGGRIVIMPRPDIGELLDLIACYRVTHTFLPPTVIYMLLDHPEAGDVRPYFAAMLLVWRGSNFVGAFDRSHEEDRAYGAALRTDRSADGSFHDAAKGPLQSRRHNRRPPSFIRRSCQSPCSGRYYG